MDLTYQQISDLIGLSTRTIRKRLDASSLEHIDQGPGKAKLWPAKNALMVVLSEDIRQALPAAGGACIDYNTERARLAKEQADKVELENAQRRGELCRTTDVKDGWARIVSRVKVKLTSLPSKISALTDEPDERRRIFIEAKAIVDEALHEIARGDRDSNP